MLHATEKVINLLTDQEELISLVPIAIGDGPHNIVLPIERFTKVPAIGGSASSSSDRLQVNGYVVEFVSAGIWNPKPDWDRIRVGKLLIQQSTGRMLDILRSETPDPGIHALFGEASGEIAGLESHFVQALLQPSARLISGLKRGDLARALQGAEGLAGLGTGLTPAGDDFMAGAMMACWTGFTEPAVLSFLPQLADQAAKLTSQLSAAYLRSSAQGEFGDIWHQFLSALYRSDDVTWRNLIRVIANIGHNSGAYTLAGFLKIVG